jgi:hypothetical protein
MASKSKMATSLPFKHLYLRSHSTFLRSLFAHRRVFLLASICRKRIFQKKSKMALKSKMVASLPFRHLYLRSHSNFLRSLFVTRRIFLLPSICRKNTFQKNPRWRQNPKWSPHFPSNTYTFGAIQLFCVLFSLIDVYFCWLRFVEKEFIISPIFLLYFPENFNYSNIP